MFCTKCGHELADGVRFCTRCGAEVKAAAPSEAEGDTAELLDEAGASDTGEVSNAVDAADTADAAASESETSGELDGGREIAEDLPAEDVADESAQTDEVESGHQPDEGCGLDEGHSDEGDTDELPAVEMQQDGAVSEDANAPVEVPSDAEEASDSGVPSDGDESKDGAPVDSAGAPESSSSEGATAEVGTLDGDTDVTVPLEVMAGENQVDDGCAPLSDAEGATPADATPVDELSAGAVPADATIAFDGRQVNPAGNAEEDAVSAESGCAQPMAESVSSASDAQDASNRQPKRRRRVAIAAAACACAAALGVGGVVAWKAGVFENNPLLSLMQGEPVAASRTSRIVPKASDGTPMEHYFVRVLSGKDKDGNAIDVSGAHELEVTDGNGFVLDDVLGDLPDGTYNLQFTGDDGNTSNQLVDTNPDNTGNGNKAPDTGDDKPNPGEGSGSVSVTDEKRQGADKRFLEKLEDIEGEHGGPKVETVGETNVTAYVEGTTYAGLVTFNDDVERLVVSYCDNDDMRASVENSMSMAIDSYQLEVWEYNEKSDKLDCVSKGKATWTNGGCALIQWYMRQPDAKDPVLLQMEHGDHGAETSGIGVTDEGEIGEVPFTPNTSTWDTTASFMLMDMGQTEAEAIGEEDGEETSDDGKYVTFSVEKTAETVQAVKDELQSRINNEDGVQAPKSVKDTEDDIEVTAREVTETVSVPTFYSGAQSDGTEDHTWGYLELSAEGGANDGIEKLNAQFKQAYEAQKAATMSWSFDNPGDGRDCVSYRSALTYAKDGVIGTRIQTYTTGWGSHGEENVTGAIYDARTGDELNAWDVAGVSEDELRAEAVDAIVSFAKAHPSNMTSMTEDEMRAEAQGCVDSGYLLTDKGITVFLPSYSMGHSFADGNWEIVVHGFDDASLVGTDVRSAYRLDE